MMNARPGIGELREGIQARCRRTRTNGIVGLMPLAAGADLLRLLRDLELGRPLAGGERQEVVVVVAVYRDSREAANRKLPRNVHPAVDVGRVGLASGDPGLVDEDLYRPSHAP